MIRVGSLPLVVCAALAIASAGAQIPPPKLDPVMALGRIGPINGCDSPTAVKALGYPAVELQKFAEGYPYQQLDVDIGQGVIVSAVLDQKFGRASPLSTSSPAFVTSTGARVGQTLADLEARYPKHDTYLSEEEGDHFIMMTGESYTYFSFPPSSIDHDCFRYWRRATPALKASCTAQMAKSRAVSFTTSCPSSPKNS